jgi:hypothetical protein
MTLRRGLALAGLIAGGALTVAFALALLAGQRTLAGLRAEGFPALDALATIGTAELHGAGASAGVRTFPCVPDRAPALLYYTTLSEELREARCLRRKGLLSERDLARVTATLRAHHSWHASRLFPAGYQVAPSSGTVAALVVLLLIELGGAAAFVRSRKQVRPARG